MNKERRKKISEIEDKVNELASEIEAVLGDEQDAYDNLPENMQSGERGDAMQNAISALESAKDSLESAASELGSVE